MRSEPTASDRAGAADTSPVLIVGAGPTGLALALWLSHLGVRCRIIDKAADVAPFSRALGVHARTLEFYRQLGFADQALAGGVIVASANLWARRTRVARIPFAHIGETLTAYPFILDFSQDAHERLLIARLGQRGVTVERLTQLVGFEETGDAVHATLRLPNGSTEACRALFIAGCDGAHSVVRKVIGAGFVGGTYDHLFYVADVTARGPVIGDGIHVDLGDADLLAVFDMKGEGHARLVGTLPPQAARLVEQAHDGAPVESSLTFADVARRPLEQLGLEVDRVNWFSTYRVHHRVASRFRRGRAFLLGDAAHVHSPVGAQGMNTGIGDATNLAWKLASVIRGDAGDLLLDTFETERIAFARRLVATTDQAFEFGTKPGRVAAFLRIRLFPIAVSVLFRLRATRLFMFRTVSQLAISYHHSALSVGRAGSVRGGDRLPWVPTAEGGHDPGNHAPLDSLKWQVHVYGDVPNDLRAVCAELGFEVHAFEWRPATRRAGFARNALYLVRPDGYVALADSSGGVEKLRAYAAAWMRPRAHRDT